MGGNAADPAERLVAMDTRHKAHKEKRGVKTKGMKEAYSANPAQQAAIAIAKKKKKEDDMVAKKKKQSMYASYQPEDEMVDEGVKEIVQGAVEGGKKIIKKGKEFVGTGIQNFKKQIDNIDNPVKGTSNILQMNSQEPEGETIEEGDKKGKGSGTKDACYHKVKSRYSVWPSAYASGALVKCRKVGAANWGNSSKKESFSDWKSEFIWEDGDSSKKLEEDKSPAWQRKEGKSESGGLNAKGVASYRRENPGSKLKTAVTTKPSKLKRGSKSAKRRKSFCSRMRGMKKKLTSAKTARDPDSRINKALRKWNC